MQGYARARLYGRAFSLVNTIRRHIVIFCAVNREVLHQVPSTYSRVALYGQFGPILIELKSLFTYAVDAA